MKGNETKVGKNSEGRFVIDSRIKFGTSTFTYLYILLFTSVCLSWHGNVFDIFEFDGIFPPLSSYFPFSPLKELRSIYSAGKYIFPDVLKTTTSGNTRSSKQFCTIS